MSGSHLSKDFFELVKAIGESKSKQEEDRIIASEVVTLKAKVGDRALNKHQKKLKEFLVRLIYVEMLGHDASFGYIKAVEMVASENLMHKRVGYLCAGLCLSPDHEFRLMLVSRLQRDMQSTNVLEVCTALMATCKLLTADMIPAVLPLVINLLKHDREIVRKKAVMVLQRFHQLAPGSVTELTDTFKRALCDKDPSVMGASLHILHDLVREEPASYKDLVPSFVSILKQITEHRLPRDFDYHRIPAPWIQMLLLRILAILGEGDQAASEGMYEVLLDVMRRADTGISVGYAIIYECVRTVTTIYPNATLLDAAAASIARFISSDNHNLKYLGVTGLAAIVKDHPKYAADHQMAVIDCLEDPDETLQRKTIDLLFRMTNPVNVEFITNKLLSFLRGAVDVFLRRTLVARVTDVAERFAPSNTWYMSTMTEVFELGGDLISAKMADNVMRLIAEGTGEDDAADAALRTFVVEAYLKLLDKHNLPDMLLQTVFWVLGEYGYVSTSTGMDAIIEKLCAIARDPTTSAASTAYAVSAVMKLTAQLGRVIGPASELVTHFATSRQGDLAQRCQEFMQLSARPQTMTAVLPVDASSEDIEVDENLSFLDGFVQQQLAAGARPYAPPSHDDDDDEAGAGAGADTMTGGLRFESYERPEDNNTYNMPETGAGAGDAGFGGSADTGSAAAAAATPATTGLNVSNVKSVWGESGYSGADTSAGTDVAGAPAGFSVDGKPPNAAVAPAKRPWDYDAAAVAAASAAVEEEPEKDTNAAPTTPGGSASSASLSGSARRAGHGVLTSEPEKPRELTEREKMAAALFGGISAAPAPAPAAASPASRTSRGSSFGAPAAAPAAAAPAPAPAAAAPAPAPSAAADLLDMFAAPAPAPAAPAVSAAAPAAALDDVFGGLSVGGATGAGGGAGAAISAAPALAADPFAAVSVPAASAGKVPAIAQMTPPQAVAASLGGASMASATNTALGNDGNLYIGANKAFKADSLVVVLYLATTGAAGLTNVRVKLAVPACYKMAGLAGSPAPRPVSADTLDMGSMSLNSSDVACLAVTMGLAAAPVDGNIQLTVTYTSSSGDAKPLQCTLPVLLRETLRPTGMQTAQFGQRWGAHPHERKVAVRTSAGSLDEVIAKLAAANIAPVQAIAATSEAIAAAQLMGTTQLALVHSRYAPGSAEVTVRTMDAGYTTTIANICAAALQ